MTKFRTKNEAKNLRIMTYGCLKCTATYTEKVKECSECHNPVMFFASRAELRRYRSLQLEQRVGAISDLELQPAYPVVLNGIKCFTYRADFIYTRDGKRVVEDVKGTTNEKYLDPAFKIKRKVVEAVYGISITITR